jgi:signal transduction histidine kinase/ActR/RegA family two-component response regulator
MLKKTYPKILLLIISSSVFFIFLYFSLYYYTNQIEKQVYKNSSEQFGNEVVKLLDLDSKPISVAIINDTNWDEFVYFFKTKDSYWYNETIGNEMNTYKVDYMGAYDIDRKFIMNVATYKIAVKDFMPQSAIAKLNKSRLIKFYMRIPTGIVEVFGASVHPSDDPLKNKTKPSGYFFVARVLDDSFINEMKGLTKSDVSLVTKKAEFEIGNNKIYATVDLKDYQNKVISRLQFVRNFDVYFDNTMNILYIIIAFFIFNLIFSLIFSRKLVYYPLSLIARILKTGNPKAIQKLKVTTGEFRLIGNLFEENINQKKELVNAKLKAEESDKLKSSFLANLSHEIRTPMNAILGFTELMTNSKLSEKERFEYLNIIDKSGRNLVAIIDDLIEMSKIDSHQVKPNYSVVNLESCINELYETIKITINKSKNIHFHIIKSDNSANYNIITDETKIKQVIINLVTNAIKFTNEGYVGFGYEIDHEKEIIKFTIKDTGVGIDKKNHKYIFDRFKRVEGESAIKVGGLGLGLAISKAYVEMVGGTIELESKANIGSVFSFSIPLIYDTSLSEVIHHEKNIEALDKEESGTILIAEDDNINYLLFQKIMKNKNYEIIRAVNGQEAVDLSIHNSKIDIVLMDIKMPIMNGYEALELIKKVRPELPIVAQTAYSSFEDKEKMKAAGFFDVVTKPIDRESLFEIIGRALKLNKSNEWGHKA